MAAKKDRHMVDMSRTQKLEWFRPVAILLSRVSGRPTVYGGSETPRLQPLAQLLWIHAVENSETFRGESQMRILCGEMGIWEHEGHVCQSRNS